MGSVAHVVDEKKELVNNVHQLELLGVQNRRIFKGWFIVHQNFELSLVVDVKSEKHLDPLLLEFK